MIIGDAKKRLVTLWFLSGAILFLIMLIMTFKGKFEDFPDKAWGWLFPNILPTLSLMISVFLFDQSNKQSNTKAIEKFYFQFAFFMSLFYILILFLTILTAPLTGNALLSQMEQSSLYLGPIQGLVAGAIGLFFLKKSEQ